MSPETRQLVRQEQHSDVLVLTIDNPPVNVVSPGVPEGLHAGLEAARADPAMRAVVIIGAGRTFIAGADVKTFDLPREQVPDLPRLVTAIEASEVPVIAALHGTALGGGLEVALASHYRVAAPGTQLGLPEVKLGVLPGAGGTQRLPRLIGVERALGMMLTGNPIRAEEARELGLVDEIILGDLLEGALAFAERVKDARPLPRSSERTAQPNSEAIQAARENLRRTARNLLSPHLIADLVEAASTRPFAEGTRMERDAFTQAVTSEQSAGLRHAFFAERAAGKVNGLGKDTPITEVRAIGVIGAGTMGGGIAMNFLNAGLPVTIVETTQEALDRGVGTIRRNYENTMRKGRLTPEQVEERMGLLTPSLDMQALADADLIIEAVFEDMSVKKDVFGRLDALAKPGAILATNTSTLDVNEIAASTSRPESAIGLHFFSPANVMRLLEIVRGAKTSDTVLATSLALAKRIGKVGVVVGVCDGFVGNRMIHAYGEEARALVEQGASPQDVDAAMHDLGLPMGPFEMSDLAGLDVGYLIRQHRAKQRGEAEPDGWLDRIVKAGRKGQKTGAGVYDYPQGRTPVPSPEIEALIATYRQEQGLTPREFTREEITRRLVATLVNEGAQILDEGIAQRASDIDTIYLNGYGFPAYRGGPMFHADRAGLGAVLEDVRLTGQTPAPLLVRLAGEGRGFADWDRERERAARA